MPNFPIAATVSINDLLYLAKNAGQFGVNQETSRNPDAFTHKEMLIGWILTCRPTAKPSSLSKSMSSHLLSLHSGLGASVKSRLIEM